MTAPQPSMYMHSLTTHSFSITCVLSLLSFRSALVRNIYRLFVHSCKCVWNVWWSHLPPNASRVFINNSVNSEMYWIRKMCVDIGFVRYTSERDGLFMLFLCLPPMIDDAGRRKWDSKTPIWIWIRWGVCVYVKILPQHACDAQMKMLCISLERDTHRSKIWGTTELQISLLLFAARFLFPTNIDRVAAGWWYPWTQNFLINKMTKAAISSFRIS